MRDSVSLQGACARLARLTAVGLSKRNTSAVRTCLPEEVWIVPDLFFAIFLCFGSRNEFLRLEKLKKHFKQIISTSSYV